MKKSSIALASLLATVSTATVAPAAFAQPVSSNTVISACGGYKGCGGCHGCHGCHGCGGCGGH